MYYGCVVATLDPNNLVFARLSILFGSGFARLSILCGILRMPLELVNHNSSYRRQSRWVAAVQLPIFWKIHHSWRTLNQHSLNARPSTISTQASLRAAYSPRDVLLWSLYVVTLWSVSAVAAVIAGLPYPSATLPV